MAARAG